MDQQKIDRLFREKLDSFEVVPSDKAWAAVEKKIGTNRSSAKFYWIAAAVSAIIVSWVVWPQQQVTTDFTPIASEVSHPAPSVGHEWSIEVVREATEEVVQPKVPGESDLQLVAQEPVKTQVHGIIEEKLEKSPLLELETKTAVALEETEQQEKNSTEAESIIEEAEGQVEEKIKVDLSKIKITYIAANKIEEKQEKDSVGAFKKFISFAGKISPGEVLADLKTKKDDFINGGFKSREKDRTSL